MPLILLSVLGLLLCGCAAPSSGSGPSESAPVTFLLEGPALMDARARLRAGDPGLKAAAERIRTEAENSLRAGPFTVVDRHIPVGGDAHDYMSQAPYFWPDPKSSNGLPYIRKDGERNPEIRKLPDHQILDDLVEATENLALGFYFHGDERCARRAAELLRIFFLDEKTRMNPRFQFAQAIPGVNHGRGIGIIEARGFMRIADSIGLLKGSTHWTSSDQAGLVDWYNKFLTWFLESKNGKDEGAALNNHGTYYDAQVVVYALFVGKKDLAQRILEEVKVKRIARQIEPDGRQPLELVRTKAWGYSVGNLQGLFLLARLGEHAGVDLWNYESADGRSIRKALDYLVPFSVGGQKWPHQQLGGFSGENLHSTLRRAAVKYPQGPYAEMVKKLPPLVEAHRSHLVR